MINKIFLNDLLASLDPKARAEFDIVELSFLQRCMECVGMSEYPAVVGPPSGERASGEMICSVCNQEYRVHPPDWRVIGYGDVPFLQVLCDGRRVKL